MKRVLLIALTVGLVAQPADLSAQLYGGIPDATEYLDFIGGSGVDGGWGVQVGPYRGRFLYPTTAQFSIYCVDYDHYAMDQEVDVTWLNGGSFGETRLGSHANPFEVYRRAAYLSSLFETTADSEWGEIHAAIWSLTSDLQGQDTGDYLTMSVPDHFSTADWYILSPLNASGPEFDGTGQEFLMRVSVPEPATFLLMASGLLLLAALSRKRLVGLAREEL
ncbi:MAG TPA: PEP-CTERM sorting domain-containing protein [Longimicrobiales bacterium]|nr:PEP-CTERM sorting domain-containing protein [Longimicrobiales bacterium]